MIAVGTLAKYYRLLPSQVIEHATTYDLMVYDVMMAWEQKHRDEAEGKVPQLSQEQMKTLLHKAKKKA